MVDDDVVVGRFYTELRNLSMGTADKQFLMPRAAELARRFKTVASAEEVKKVTRQLGDEVAGPQPIVGTLSGALEEQNRWLGAAQAALKVLREK